MGAVVLAGDMVVGIGPPRNRRRNPPRHRPLGARTTIAWVATLDQEDIAEEDPDPYPGFEPVNVHRAMSLVPEEVAGFFELDQALYLPQAAIWITSTAR